MRRSRLLALPLALTLAVPAQAQLVTSSSPFFSQVLDLGAFTNGNYNFTFGPVLIQAGVTFVADPLGGGNSGLGSVIGQGSYGLAANGSWGNPFTYVGLDSGNGWMRILFSSPVGGVGGFLNYAPGEGGAPFIRALASDLSVLASYNLATDAPISTPGGFNDGAFRGILWGSNDIWGFELANSYIVGTDFRYGVYDATTIPEPSTLLLLASGMVGIGLVGWRRRQLRR